MASPRDSTVPRNPRYESLDLWRGVACLAVVAFHSCVGYVATEDLDSRVREHGGDSADWAMVVIARLWVGVPLFFVVSGYCIAAAADSARHKPWAGASFFYRRARRIYPPLWAVLAVTAAVAALLPAVAMPGPSATHAHPLANPADLSAWHWVGNLTLTEEWRPHLVGPPKDYLTGQVWTLCYEEQFYILVGLIVLTMRRWLFPALAAVTALVFLNILDLGPALAPYQLPRRGFFFDGLWLAFAAGVAVYYRANYATPILRWCLDGLLAAGLLWAIRDVPTPWDYRPNLVGYLIPSFAAALLLGRLHRFDAIVADARLLAPLRFCGRMCYSLYLVHAPVALLISWNLYRVGVTSPTGVLLITLPIAAACSVGLSYLFHRLVERRFLNTPPKDSARSRSPAPVAVARSEPRVESLAGV